MPVLPSLFWLPSAHLRALWRVMNRKQRRHIAVHAVRGGGLAMAFPVSLAAVASFHLVFQTVEALAGLQPWSFVSFFLLQTTLFAVAGVWAAVWAAVLIGRALDGLLTKQPDALASVTRALSEEQARRVGARLERDLPRVIASRQPTRPRL